MKFAIVLLAAAAALAQERPKVLGVGHMAIAEHETLLNFGVAASHLEGSDVRFK